ncbi:MAG: hypothetical protein ACLFQB_00910 [Chitinispirillaceae bacterium]
MKMKAYILIVLCAASFFWVDAAKFNAFGQKHYTVESQHFRIHYHKGLDHLTERVAGKLEELYEIYTETYQIVLPNKTDVVLYDGEVPDAFAYPNFNFLFLGIHDYEFNLRGSSDWLEDVITHEFAHVVSIWSGKKLHNTIPSIQLGYFTHPNQHFSSEALHVYSTDILPPWFTEGIAQYESSRHGSDSWDSHRDMIIRTLVMSDKMLSWDHMQVFTGRGDDYEKTYNHGFSLTRYIADTYGYEKVVSLLRESARFDRLSFDGAIKAVLGISAKKLYDDWKRHLKTRYKHQIREIGTQVYGKKLNKFGYDNRLPRFSPDDQKIYFLSNGKNDYSLRSLMSYTLSDTVEEDKRVKFEMPITNDYDIHAQSGKIAFVSMKSGKSVKKPHKGGLKTFDLFIDTLSPEKKSFNPFKKKTERQVTTGKSVFTTAFSPKGDRLACAVRKYDRYYLAITDTSGKKLEIVYPEVKSQNSFFKSVSSHQSSSDSTFLNTIYSLSWSPDGHSIAVDFIDGDNRKVGIYDTLSKSFSLVCNTEHDERNPHFSSDGSALYFSSDRSGIFNIYRYKFSSGKLERVTNVSGGAFSPAVSKDGKKLVYAGYDHNGYGIYLIDSMKVLDSQTPTKAVSLRKKRKMKSYKISLSNRRNYSKIPRQLLVVPTLLGEQMVTSEDDETKGITRVKAGVIFNFMDPLAWAGVGNEGGAFFLIEPSRIFSFINPDKGGINPKANYDAGVYGTSDMLPLSISADYMVRGIAGEDWFYEESEERMEVLPYNIQLQNFLLSTSHDFTENLGVSLFTGFDMYDVSLDLEEAYGQGVFKYNLSKGYRVGAMAHMLMQMPNARSLISPTGMAAKLQYNYWNELSLKEENSFSTESSILKERYDRYRYHELKGQFKLGTPTFIPRHDLHFDLSGSYIKPAGNPEIPSFYLPVSQVPGYIYYYQDEKTRVEYGDTNTVIHDTVLVSGKAVLNGELSYRFPLWPESIDKKLSFIYFDKLYGALNFAGGAGWDTPEDALEFKRSDWIFSYGAEVRLEALSFSTYPMALSFRWDNGPDRPSPIGGNRFSFSIGFSFDNWDMISVPDYSSKSNLNFRYSSLRGK